MIHLDTHVVLWLAAGGLTRFPAPAVDLLESERLAISPMVELELRLLYEVERIGTTPGHILATLFTPDGVTYDDTPFARVAQVAASDQFAFTRDPFDRVIAAQAAAAGAQLLTRDRSLRKNLDFAVWD